MALDKSRITKHRSSQDTPTLIAANTASSASTIGSIAVCRPLLPGACEMQAYLAEMDENRWYTNYGPLVQRLERAFSSLFGIPEDGVITCANGTMALTQALLATVERTAPDVPAYCITPAWSFVATPAAITSAGLKPYFADVSIDSWALDPQQTEVLIHELRRQGKTVAAVMPVAPFGAPLDMQAWEQLRERTGVAVVIDAAAGFDGLGRSDAPSHERVGRLPVVVSLHATKAFGIGEGALILTRDSSLTRRMRAFGNFGFSGSRSAEWAGINNKMSELHAAVGLAQLAKWPALRQSWQALSQTFQAHIATSAPWLTPVSVMADEWISSYGLIRFADPAIALEHIVYQLNSAGIETRRWWGDGCDRQPAYAACEHSSLNNTRLLASTTLGLPFWIGLEECQVTRMFSALGAAVSTNPQTHRKKAAPVRK